MTQTAARGAAAPAQLFDLSACAFADLFTELPYAWQALTRLAAYLEKRLQGVHSPKVAGEVHPQAVLEGPVLIEAGARVGPGVYIQGPAYIGAESQIRQGAYIRGNTLVGRRCVVGHATEVKGSILLDGAQAPHFNYVGDSILGHGVNLGAGTVLSNLKHDHGEIAIVLPEGAVATGLQKLGAILGDGTETGCNCVCAPGTVTGPGVWIYPNALVRGYIPPASIVKLRQALEVVSRSAPRLGKEET